MEEIKRRIQSKKRLEDEQAEQQTIAAQALLKIEVTEPKQIDNQK